MILFFSWGKSLPEVAGFTLRAGKQSKYSAEEVSRHCSVLQAGRAGTLRWSHFAESSGLRVIVPYVQFLPLWPQTNITWRGCANSENWSLWALSVLTALRLTEKAWNTGDPLLFVWEEEGGRRERERKEKRERKRERLKKGPRPIFCQSLSNSTDQASSSGGRDIAPYSLSLNYYWRHYYLRLSKKPKYTSKK